MEDFFEARFAQVGEHTVGLFGVFDGMQQHVASHIKMQKLPILYLFL